MKAIVVTDQSMGTAEMKLVERPEPRAAINDVVVQIYPSGFVPTELAWPSIWTDRLDRDRTPSVPGQELAGVVTALGYGTTGLSVGQRVLGLADWYRDGTLAEYVAVEARNLAPRPGDVDSTVASLRAARERGVMPIAAEPAPSAIRRGLESAQHREMPSVSATDSARVPVQLLALRAGYASARPTSPARFGDDWLPSFRP
jgi:hypothetical protein